MAGSIVRLKGLKKYKHPTTGIVYVYHRVSGKRLTAEFGSAEFMEQYAAAGRGVAEKPAAKEGSLGIAIIEYRMSDRFTELADTTRKDYDRYLNRLADISSMPLDEVTPAFIAKLRDGYKKNHGYRAANLMLTVLRLVLNKAKESGYIKINPAIDMDNASRPKSLGRANRPWEPEEVATVMDAAQPHIRIVIALCRATGFRISDAIRVNKSSIRDGWFQWQTRKRGVVAYLPIRGWLADELDRAPKHDAITILATSDGTPWASSDSVGCMVRRLFAELVEAGKVGTGLTLHGLRHTIGHDLADAGCNEDEIAAWLAHTSTSTAKIYTAGAKRKRHTESARRKLDGAK